MANYFVEGNISVKIDMDIEAESLTQAEQKVMKIKELRNLPFRKWDEVKNYKSIVVLPSGKKHDSGWALMYIIGLDSERKPIEIAAACDDICWKIPTATEYNFRNDMFYPSGAIHFWSNGHSFKVGASLSSTDVFLVKN
jgi:hypothetical protein